MRVDPCTVLAFAIGVLLLVVACTAAAHMRGPEAHRMGNRVRKLCLAGIGTILVSIIGLVVINAAAANPLTFWGCILCFGTAISLSHLQKHSLPIQVHYSPAYGRIPFRLLGWRNPRK